MDTIKNFPLSRVTLPNAGHISSTIQFTMELRCRTAFFSGFRSSLRSRPSRRRKHQPYEEIHTLMTFMKSTCTAIVLDPHGLASGSQAPARSVFLVPEHLQKEGKTPHQFISFGEEKNTSRTTYLRAYRVSALHVLSVPAPARHAYHPSARPRDRPMKPRHRDEYQAPSRSALPSRQLFLLRSARAVEAAWVRYGGRL